MFIMLANFENYPRMVVNNDWVVLSVLLCICLYIFMIHFLKGESNIIDFFTSTLEDSTNVTISWFITSFCHVLLLSTLLVDYLPYIPMALSEYQIAGYTVSRFGFVFISLSVFYLLKTMISYFYYQSIGENAIWEMLTFVITKFYFVISFLLIGLIMANYFYLIDRLVFFKVIAVLGVILFIFKLLFYHFNYSKILPELWYYKFLYICTLQIAPVFAIWKVLFY